MTSAASSSTLARHNHLVNVYKSYKAGDSDLTTFDKAILRQHHQFIRDDEEDGRQMTCHWEVRMARKYYNKLFKEYALADLSRYTEGKVGLRWRTEAEVVVGKGQFSCGNLACNAKEKLHSYEVPFRYKEQGQVKEELVKVRLCPPCAEKLYYNKLQEEQRNSSDETTDCSNDKDTHRKKKKRKHSHTKDEKASAAKTFKTETPPAASRPTTTSCSAADLFSRAVSEEARKVASDADMDAFLTDLFM